MIVAALGGHLLAAEDLSVRAALAPLAGSPLVVTHGNGPQVGEELLRAPETPIHVAVARTQAEIGSRLARELGGVCVVTHVVVAHDDPAFDEPTKPIGPWSEERPPGAAIREAGRGWRRVVASPRPREVVEREAIGLLAAAAPVVACGGGGIPVVRRAGALEPVDAVIDKDRASALLAAALGADRLIVLTDVDGVYRDFRGPGEQVVELLTADEADGLLPELPAGSMRPKVEACAAFVRATGGEALVTCPERLADALAGRAGTRVQSMAGFPSAGSPAVA